jgi:hypothetical protein
MIAVKNFLLIEANLAKPGYNLSHYIAINWHYMDKNSVFFV